MHSEMILFETQQRPEGYRIFGTETGAYTAYHSLSPDGFSPDNSVAGFTRELLAPDLYPGRRSYFHILDEAGNHFVTAPRGLGFESVLNFRELGGYPAGDGRRVRWGRFYRSARLGTISPEEKQRFAQLGIRVVLDLRSDSEIAQMPDPVFEGSEQKVISALFQKNKQQVNLDPGVLFTFSPEEMLKDDAEFTERYRQMPFDNEAYQYLFDKLEKGEALSLHGGQGPHRCGRHADPAVAGRVLGDHQGGLPADQPFLPGHRGQGARQVLQARPAGACAALPHLYRGGGAAQPGGGVRGAAGQIRRCEALFQRRVRAAGPAPGAAERPVSGGGEAALKLLSFGSLNLDQVYRVRQFARPGESVMCLE